ncbi:MULTISPECIES: hypothetical protein [unclassified Dinoroseobacter]|uniref:hypothetical protein n=1 Tax=unclassified Dinoroseobacter TaxID=2620028 RepID=UPI003C7CE197
MKRILTYTTALTLLAAPVLADAKMDLVREAQTTLNEYNIAFDADALSMEQLAEIKALDLTEENFTQQRLEQIVGVSASDTAVDGYVATPDVELEVNIPESDVVQGILDEYDIAVDADSLSNEKKAEILALDTSEENFTKERLEQIVFG